MKIKQGPVLKCRVEKVKEVGRGGERVDKRGDKRGGKRWYLVLSGKVVCSFHYCQLFRGLLSELNVLLIALDVIIISNAWEPCPRV